MRVAFVVPAYQAEASVGRVVEGLLELGRATPDRELGPVLVVDDGSTDATAHRARDAGATVLRLPHNQGKGSALRRGLAEAHAQGARAAVTVDADGQHPTDAALLIARHPAPADALVLGVRDLRRDGAPRANQWSNAFSNTWMSWFCGRKLRDTQCGLRRYPLPEVLQLGLLGTGYELEAEVIVRAVRRGLPLVEADVRVIYPPAGERVSHFHSVRDPARIVARLLHTAATTRWSRG